jgi:adenylosuccinate synthase
VTQIELIEDVAKEINLQGSEHLGPTLKEMSELLKDAKEMAEYYSTIPGWESFSYKIKVTIDQTHKAKQFLEKFNKWNEQ